MPSLQLPQLGAAADAPFPATSNALRQPNGLLAWGGDLTRTRLLNAYRAGIFPWYSGAEPILWWSPSPRCVIVPGAIHLSRRTRRRYNTGTYQVTADTAFRAVITACAGLRAGQDGTWISAGLKASFCKLHQAGLAHSIEVWQQGQLVGGIYGLALGAMFFGESMFSHTTDASKIALVALCRHLERWSFGLLDCQIPNPHLLSMGAIALPRSDFEGLLAGLVVQPGQPGSWQKRFRPESRW